MKRIIKLLIISSLCLLVLFFGINIYMKVIVKSRIVSRIDTDYILVLGASAKKGSVSLMLKDRLDMAYNVYMDNDAKIILSGDSINSDEYDEVGSMRAYLINLGVSSDDLILDNYGISTYDSIYHLKDIVKDKKVVIITQKYHLYRALYIASSLGIDNSYGIASSGDNYYNQEYRNFREFLARVKDYFKCIIKPSSKYSYNF